MLLKDSNYNYIQPFNTVFVPFELHFKLFTAYLYKVPPLIPITYLSGCSYKCTYHHFINEEMKTERS